MLDAIEVAKLEKLYAKRQTKRLLKYLFVCLFAIALLATAIFYSFDDATKNSSIELAKNEQKEEQEYANAKPDKQIQDNEEDIKKAQKQALKEKARAKIKEEEAMLAEIDLSGYFNEVPESAISKEPLYRTQIEEPEYSSTNSTPAISVKSTEIQPNYNSKSSKNNIKISSAPIKSSLESIEEHFKNSKDPKDALALARDYYSKKDYKNAAKWAFELNNLDKKNADGWLIFAKSKYNVGNKKDALKVLEAYLSQASNKEEVQNLITKMQSNIPLSE
ncbi:MAG: CDC27 family protein [Campylobacter sp.]|uniref:CDC27 family protein n=1 Tax=Campylobacter sp. TaxID=205 RepID=UPI002AA87857|nr:CDC27 family protein [Campylobacter sp.]MCI7586646.1 CDC27 family protein [Campylobacter sp.]